MTDQHPITPPPELVEQWVENAIGPDYEQVIATQAARWGADMELEACCEWVVNTHAYDMTPGALRTARRPKPPSLKEQALERCNNYIDPDGIIRRALEALDD